MTEQTLQQPPRKPEIAGDLTKQEQGLLEQMRNRAQQIVHRVGSMEVEKARLMKMLDQQEQQIQLHLQAIGNRLEIPQGAGWQVAGDKAVIVQPVPELPKKVETPTPETKDEAPEDAPLPENQWVGESVNEVEATPTETEEAPKASETEGGTPEE